MLLNDLNMDWLPSQNDKDCGRIEDVIKIVRHYHCEIGTLLIHINGGLLPCRFSVGLQSDCMMGLNLAHSSEKVSQGSPLSFQSISSDTNVSLRPYKLFYLYLPQCKKLQRVFIFEDSMQSKSHSCEVACINLKNACNFFDNFFL